MKTAFHEFAVSTTALQASMKINASGSGLHLGKYSNLQLRDAAGWTVRAVRGTVWITQDQDVRDIVLEAGESFLIERKGTTLLHALADSRVCVARTMERPAVKVVRRPAWLARYFPQLPALFA